MWRASSHWKKIAGLGKVETLGLLGFFPPAYWGRSGRQAHSLCSEPQFPKTTDGEP